MRKLPLEISVLALAALAFAGPGASQPAAAPAPAAQATLDLRLRAEEVEQDGLETAQAVTLRTLLSYRTATWRHWSLEVAAEDVRVLGDDDFDNAGAGGLGNGRSDHAVIADVELTELDQAFARLDLEPLDLVIGRQEVNIADERFIGAVGWRQNHQSFDALRLDTAALGPVSLTYLYLDRVHRFFVDTRDADAHYLQAQAGLGGATVRGYALRLSSAAGLGPGTRTLGVEVAGEKVLGGRAWVYEAELAQQDSLSGSAPVDAGYLHLLAGTGIGPLAARAGLEILEGSPRDGRFSTPLATLHKFNGWADKFLQTPANGLEDAYLSLAGGRERWKWTLAAHRFRAESAPVDLGRELDAMLTWRSPWDQTFGLKVADYRADTHATDTTKWMLWSEVRF